MPGLANARGDVPEPTAEQVLLRVLVEAHIATVPRRRGEKYLRTVAEKLAGEENFAAVFQIKPSPHASAARAARTQAAEMYRRWLPVLLARLNDD